MPIGSQGILLSNDVLAKWLIEDFPFRIQPAQFMPFIPIDGHELRYATTGALTPGVPINFNQLIPDDTKIPISPNRTSPLGELATHFRVAYSAQDRFSNVNDQVAVQISLAIRELLYRFWTLFETGNPVNPGEFRGLVNFVDPAKEIDLAAAAPTLNNLDALVGLNTFNDGYSSFFITNTRGYQAMRAAHYTRGVNPQQCARMVSFPTGSEMRELFCFDGIPVLVLDFIQIAANLTSIWLVTFGPNGLHGIVPASVGRSMFVTRSTILPDDTKLVYHMTMPVGMALGSLCALARLKNVLV